MATYRHIYKTEAIKFSSSESGMCEVLRRYGIR